MLERWWKWRRRIGKVLKLIAAPARAAAKLRGEFIIFSLGTILLGAGAWMAYRPAGLIVAGGVMIGDVIFGRMLVYWMQRKKED